MLTAALKRLTITMSWCGVFSLLAMGSAVAASDYDCREQHVRCNDTCGTVGIDIGLTRQTSGEEVTFVLQVDGATETLVRTRFSITLAGPMRTPHRPRFYASNFDRSGSPHTAYVFTSTDPLESPVELHVMTFEGSTQIRTLNAQCYLIEAAQ